MMYFYTLSYMYATCFFTINVSLNFRFTRRQNRAWSSDETAKSDVSCHLRSGPITNPSPYPLAHAQRIDNLQPFPTDGDVSIWIFTSGRKTIDKWFQRFNFCNQWRHFLYLYAISIGIHTVNTSVPAEVAPQARIFRCSSPLCTCKGFISITYGQIDIKLYNKLPIDPGLRSRS